MRFSIVSYFPLIVLGTLAGCVGSSATPLYPEPRPGGNDMPAYRAPERPSASADKKAEVSDPTGAVSLRHVLSLALLRSPQLATYSWETRAAEARVLQAGLLPNPELEAEVGEFGGRDGRKGFDGAETSIRLSQLLELGGQRGKRVRVAELERSLAGWDYEAKRLDVLAEAATAFVVLLAAQEQVALAERLHSLAEAEWKIAAERVKFGKAPPLEELQAKAASATAQVRVGQAKREVEAARVRLAATWGGRSATFEKAVGLLRSVEDVASFDELVKLLPQTPEIARWATEMERRRAILAQERAKGIPSPSLSAGATRFQETDDYAFGLGLSVPLPIFDRNQGGRREALYGVAKAEKEREAEEVRIAAAFSDAYQTLASAIGQARGLEKEVLPAAQAAFDAANEGYRQGKFGYLEVLNARRALFDAEEQMLGILTSYHTTKVALERLLGQGLGPAEKK